MDRSKVIAIITGVISVALAIAYLLLVQILDMRGEMVPAPIDLSWLPTALRAAAGDSAVSWLA
ncbi:MAG: hypothetical protein AAGF24_13250 [Cyanobacteria bacterium P01_H01_bin.121]